jgi:hypothetical protein
MNLAARAFDIRTLPEPPPCNVVTSADSPCPPDPSNLFQAGSAHVFVRSGGVWSQQAEIFAGDAASFEQFGQFVALHGDTALIGTPFDSHPGLSTAGSAYVFTRSVATWSQQQKIVAFDAAANDWFGYGVDLHGDTALVGAPRDDHGGFDNAGSAYVYTRSGAAWSLQQKITSPATRVRALLEPRSGELHGPHGLGERGALRRPAVTVARDQWSVSARMRSPSSSRRHKRGSFEASSRLLKSLRSMRSSSDSV